MGSRSVTPVLIVLLALTCVYLPNILMSFSLQTVDRDSIPSGGYIYYPPSVNGVHAASGHARDIQAAIDQVSSTGGNVILPAGTFQFYNVGEIWQEVVIPAGVNLYGASTVRDADDHVVEWRTILVMPFNAPENSKWFRIQGTGDYHQRSRINGLKLVGYRDMDPSITTKHWAIYVDHAIDWRVDHCYLKEFCEGVAVRSPADQPLRGVIDHNFFVNEYGVPHVNDDWYQRTNGYAVSVSRAPIGSLYWDPNIENIFGHYTDYTVVIEDNVFQRWRHCVSANEGVHYIFRYNTITNDHGSGSIDAHGSMFDPTYVGTRAIEVYNNALLNPITTYNDGYPVGIYVRGGGGVIFNNTVRGYAEFCRLFEEEMNTDQTRVKDLWLWENDIDSIPMSRYVKALTGQQEGVDYHLYKKPGYIPLVYPHPLTS